MRAILMKRRSATLVAALGVLCQTTIQCDIPPIDVVVDRTYPDVVIIDDDDCCDWDRNDRSFWFDVWIW